MNRRGFLRANCSMCAGLALTRALPVFAHAVAPAGWRTFEVVTRVDLTKPKGASRIWLPAALIRDTPYQRVLSNRITAGSGTVTMTMDKQSALGIVSATYPRMPNLH